MKIRYRPDIVLPRRQIQLDPTGATELQMNAPPDNQPRHELEQGFKLGELRIDPRAGEVSGPGGSERLDPKVMDVLVLLAQHAGQVVLREHVLAELWPNMVVTDDALSRCIYELRRQLSQAAGEEQYKSLIETVPKRGYRLNGEVTLPQPRSAAHAAKRRNGRWLALASAIPAILLLLYAAGRHGGSGDAGSNRTPIAVWRIPSPSCRSSI